MVFMGHGLTVAFFVMTTVVAAAALWRVRIRVRRIPSAAVMAYLGILLFLCKSFAALMYGTVLGFLVRFTRPRLQLHVALMLTAIALLYPLFRSADLVPTTTMLNVAESISAERADSLKTRFDSEEKLLGRARERFVFGWGRYGRSRLYNEVGEDFTRSDGAWIITVGQFGLVGFFGLFGLLALPVFRANSAVKLTKSTPDGVLLAALALIVAVNIFDLLPNSGMNSWSWLLVGALLGRAEALQIAARRPQEIGPRLGRSRNRRHILRDSAAGADQLARPSLNLSIASS